MTDILKGMGDAFQPCAELFAVSSVQDGNILYGFAQQFDINSIRIGERLNARVRCFAICGARVKLTSD